VSKSAIDDKQILEGTTQLSEGEYCQFKFTLPETGRTLTSEKFPQSELKGEVLIRWCDSVRAQIAADVASDAGEKEKKRRERIKRKKEEEEESQEQYPTDLPPGAERTVMPDSVATSEDLWTQYGRLLGEVERIKARLRAAGEKV
jgi:hypothetical protein